VGARMREGRAWFEATAEVLGVTYFDGQSARAHPAQLAWSDGLLAITWSGGSLHCADGAAWDAFASQRPGAARESWVVRAQQSWRGVLVAVVLLIGVAVAGYRWGVPAVASGVLAALPLSADKTVGELALDGIEGRWLKPSRLPSARRERIAADFERLVQAAFPAAAERPAYTLRFHASKIGPNAFALPGGTIVLTDELVTLMDGRDNAVLGVLAHELGHVRLRHGMRLVVQVSLIGAATSVALGDFSSVLAAAPALMGQLAYSRDAEREADAESVRLMKAAGIRPDAMVEFFERAQRWKDSEEGRKLGADIDLGIGFSSHPADAERVAFFRAASR
jgi:Zn-dependent protease with chaperone function